MLGAMFRAEPFLSVALIAMLSPAVLAQLTTGKVLFKNPGPYQQAELESAAGIHKGDKVSNAALQAAAQKLIDTGYFDDVGVGVEGPVSALNVTFTLKPLEPAKLTKTGFENFVWLTPEELAGALHRAAPLFHGQLPDAGNQPAALTAALQSALEAKGVKATVVQETLEPSIKQPIRLIEYRVEQPVVRLHAVALQGVDAALSPEVAKIEAKLKGGRYSEGPQADSTTELLLQPFRDAGYLDAKLTNVRRNVAQSTPAEAEVDFSATVVTGDVYKVGSISLAGVSGQGAEAASSASKLHPGDVASHKLLMESLAPVDATYRKQGYMDVLVDPGAKLHPATHTVSYTVSVVPGPQYRVRSVRPVGLSAEAQKDFDAGWRMGPGELYNPQYVETFLGNNTALRALAGYAATFEASADPQAHTVDLTIKFVRTGGRR